MVTQAQYEISYDTRSKLPHHTAVKVIIRVHDKLL